MSGPHWLLLATCALSIYGVGNVWPVQVSSYPLWVYVGAREFDAYHRAWWHSIWGVIIAPAALVALGAALMMWWPAPSVPSWAIRAGVGLQAALVLGTALWWAPLMARLGPPTEGPERDRFRLLLATHWLRVAIVTAHGALSLWMVAQSAWPAGTP